jgi:hypothetical protein
MTVPLNVTYQNVKYKQFNSFETSSTYRCACKKLNALCTEFGIVVEQASSVNIIYTH